MQPNWTAGLHHDGSALYVSNPLPRHDEQVTLRLRAPANAPITGVFVRTEPDGEPHIAPMERKESDGLTVWWVGTLHASMPLTGYRFRITTPDATYHLNQAGVTRSEPLDYNDFKLLADFAAPHWVEGAVFYQIFPDRFHNGDPSNDVPSGLWEIRGHKTQHRPWGALPLPFQQGGGLDFYGGDLIGIAQKLDYLHDLGITALYLNPIFTARSNHRYDVADFNEIDPYLGGNAALAALREALDRYGMRLILDVTLNHCGWFNNWFLEAQANPNAPTAEYFTFYEHPRNYASWLGHKSLPKLNYRSQRLRDALYRVPDSAMRQWMRPPYRVDGWRLDVQNMQARQGKFQAGHEVGREIRAAVKAEMPDAYLYGENFYDATGNLQGDELDGTMNYQGFTIPLWRWLVGYDLGVDFGRAGADPHLLPGEIMTEQWTTHRAAIPWVVARQQYNLLCSHDTVRILTILKGDKALLRLAAALLMAYPGVPSIYYGDEIGLEGGRDPDNRRCMPWDEATWDRDLRTYYQRLIALRRTAPALLRGGFQQLYALDGLIAFQRQSAEQRLVFVGYRGPAPTDFNAIPVWQGGLRDGSRLVDLLGGGEYTVEAGVLRLGRLERGAALILEAR